MRSLLESPKLQTVSLTPGVGESRLIEWAHVYEAADPWKWFGRNALLLTAGSGVPASAEDQCQYLRRVHDAGIAAVVIDSTFGESCFSGAAVLFASRIGFPLLQAGQHVQFITIAAAVAEVSRREREQQAASMASLRQAFAERTLRLEGSARRNDWIHGSFLLSQLVDSSDMISASAHLATVHGVEAPYAIALWYCIDAQAEIYRVHRAFAARNLAALATLQEGCLLVLSHHGDELFDTLTGVANSELRIGVSASFQRLEQLHAAVDQARSVLIRNQRPGEVLQFRENLTESLFLPNDTDQLRSIARQVLGPLQTYDRQRGTSLTQTLRVFLEENRGWVRAAERLYVHRQTLVARISRIEKIVGRDLSSMEDTAECWLAIQAAVAIGEL